MSIDRVEAALQRGAAFIASRQLKDGSFESYSSPVRTPFRPDRTYHTTFTPALILTALARLPANVAGSTREKLANWLLAQKSQQWSFNYWAHDEPARKTMPYPDDLDDTFCALIALHRHDAALIDQSCLGHVVRLLIATETAVGGPYRTWLVASDAPEAWRDVDLAVNTNIACFLRAVAQPLPSLQALMEQAITTNSWHSPYYPSPYPLFYYLARAYQGPKQQVLARRIRAAQKHGFWRGPLNSALAISALLQLEKKEACETAVAYLLQEQRSDGSWPAEAFCLDPALEGRKFFCGSEALTTALALEALAGFARISTSHSPHAAQPKIPHVYERIMTTARADLGSLDTTLASYSLQTLGRVDAGDKTHEITLLPYLFSQSLHSQPQTNDDLFRNLGLANLYGWVAYTVYDDFLDDEGDPQLLSVANVCLRYSLQYFEKALPGNTAFQQFVFTMFNTIDGANAWEIAHARARVHNNRITLGSLPRYGHGQRLAERSLGHALAPLGVLAAAGEQVDSLAARELISAFKHYLIARQLNDDLHDWQQDLHAGILTYVNVKILQELKIKPGATALKTLVPRMQRQFWHHTLPAVCNIITQHTALARRHAAKSKVLTNPNILTKLLDGIDASVVRTQKEQTKAEDFLTAFKG